MTTSFSIAFACGVAALQLGYFVLESFLWNTPLSRRIFKRSPEEARVTTSLAWNLGFYNAFLGAGLLWSLLTPTPMQAGLPSVFLAFVFLAGIVGARFTPATLLAQSAPAAASLALLHHAL
jgi:putative membrane protein